jgi:tripartite-type tricarboxylate transporter receptor subunit TctC
MRRYPLLQLTAIAVASKKRSPLAPDVPTMMEVGSAFGLGNFQTETCGMACMPPEATAT